jgi:hypothetical protein
MTDRTAVHARPHRVLGARTPRRQASRSDAAAGRPHLRTSALLDGTCHLHSPAATDVTEAWS